MNEAVHTREIGALDVDRARKDFPALHQEVHGTPLVYLDNAATSQKPQAVVDRIVDYYTRENSNIHRGVHQLSQLATDAYENARSRVAAFINAPAQQVIFTRGTTEAINLVASTFGRMTIRRGDEILITALEHHSNIVPWQLLCQEKGAVLQVVPVDDNGEIIYSEFQALLSERTRLLAIAHVSNALGTILPVRRMIEDAHALDIPVVLDGAQAVPHMRVDVLDLDCDFYCFSAHKMFGPTGVGALYGKAELLERMPPYQGGGDMIRSVSFTGTTYNDVPHKFEAGTPNIAGVIGFGAAVDYLETLGMESINRYEHELLEYATERMLEVDGVRIVGTAAEKASVLSFMLEGIHPYDAGTILDRLGIAVRTGHHCTQPLMARFGIPGTIRASFALYNTRDDVDRLVEGVRRVNAMLGA